MKKLINNYKESIIPPYTKKDLPTLIITGLMLIGIPVAIILSNQQSKNTSANAAGSVVAVEAESGALAAPATVISDPLASAGNAVDLGPASSTACNGVQVSPGQDIQALINANAAGTIFCLAPGVHRVSSALIPKNNNQFIGAFGAIIDGAKVVTGWTPSGSDWVATGFLPSNPPAFGTCDPAFPLCNQAQDIFRDGTWLSPVSSRASLASGKAYLDYTNNKIYVRDDPTGRTMEQSFSPKLFTGTGTGVQIKNLIVQHAASPSNTGVIDPDAGGSGWVLDHNEIRWNHGIGTGPGGAVFGQTNNMTITANNVHHNGQDGTGADGVGNVVQGNEVHHNSYAGYDAGWDAGNKFGHARNLIVTGNYYHDERGPGIWCDINCENVTIANNYVARASRGIMYEISCGASIHDNIIVDSTEPVANSWGGIGILIAESENVEVYNNKIYNGNRGVWAIHSERTEARDCTGGAEHVVKNLNVHDNHMDLNDPNPPFGGKVGLWTDSGRTDIYTAAFNNVFNANTYHQVTPSSVWDWGMNTPPYTPQISFSAWQGFGKDTNGSVVADDPAAPPPPMLVTGPQSSSSSGATDNVTINVPTSGTYRVWSRIMAPDSANNSYKLQIDNGSAIIVGNAVIPTSTWTWVNYRDGSTATPIDVTLTAGAHTITLIGTESNVKVDRLIFTIDTACTPTGTGDNCIAADTPTPTPTQVLPTATPTPGPGTQINAGYQTPLAGQFDSGNNNGISSTQVVSGSSEGTLNSISVYIGAVGASPGNHMQVALYADTGANAPGARLTSSGSQVLTANSWNTFPLSGVAITANTKYWLAFNEDSSATQYGRASLTTGLSAWKIPTTYGTWPNPFGTVTEPNAAKAYAVYMTYTSGGVINTPTPTLIPTSTLTPTPTSIPSGDTIKPTVTITSPANGSLVPRKTNIAVQATASDNVGVTRVEFRRNGVLTCTDTTVPYSCSVTSDNGKNVTISIEARAFDAAGNTGISTISVRTQ